MSSLTAESRLFHASRHDGRSTPCDGDCAMVRALHRIESAAAERVRAESPTVEALALALHDIKMGCIRTAHPDGDVCGSQLRHMTDARDILTALAATPTPAATPVLEPATSSTQPTVEALAKAMTALVDAIVTTPLVEVEDERTITLCVPIAAIKPAYWAACSAIGHQPTDPGPYCARCGATLTAVVQSAERHPRDCAAVEEAGSSPARGAALAATPAPEAERE